MITTLRRLTIFFLIVTAPLWISALIWQLSPKIPLKLSLVDYTVPFDNYAEHSASVWAFNHLKVVPPTITGPVKSRETWHRESSYSGPEPFRPYIHRRLHQTLPLDQLKDRKSPFDIIYIADTYGVYREDFIHTFERNGQLIQVSDESDPELLKELFDQGEVNVHMDYSKLIFGGLSAEDLDVIEHHTQAGGDVFFEFNAFCDPTPVNVRERAEKVAGLKWTGWSARFLMDPTDKDDTPHWLERAFIKQFPSRSLPNRPSLLLAHRDGRVYLVESDDPKDVLPTLHLKNKELERFEISNSPYYYFWFALMSPDLNSGIEVLAEIHLHAPEDNKSIYELLDLPERVPLLTERAVGQSHRFYLSIDGSDIRENLGKYWYAGLGLLNSVSPKNRGIHVNQRQVFWQFYLPMLNVILWERSVQRYPDFPPPIWRRLLDFGSRLISFTDNPS